jgi:DNA-binding CsgD family transcriptional regulator
VGGQARRELSKITTGRPADGLTGEERSIAALIAQGQTNWQIASALFVPPNTLQTHLRHIFQKLGVRSRTELAAQFLASTPERARPEYH